MLTSDQHLGQLRSSLAKPEAMLIDEAASNHAEVTSTFAEGY